MQAPLGRNQGRGLACGFWFNFGGQTCTSININLDGTVVSSNDDWNKAYYGKPALPPDILVKGSASAKGADKLLADVAKAAGGK